MEYPYLTPEDYENAEKNGISRERATDRFYRRGWTKQRTITQPVRKQSNERAAYREIAKKNGISNRNFARRISRGWSLEEASSLPIGRVREIWEQKRKITKEQLAVADKNGIPRITMWKRVNDLRWPVEKAISEPVKIKHRRRSS